MKKHYRVVIVGAGIAGCSIAYHMADLGWKDIVVVDQSPLFETGGSTSHAPGLVFQINSSRTMSRFARYTADLWTRMKLDDGPCARAVGSMEVAWTAERLEDLKRKLGYAMAYGIEAHLLSSNETRQKVPPLSPRILGALYVPSDIQTKATRPAEAMAIMAQQNGTEFYGNTRVIGFGITDDQINSVQTNRGDIKTDLVVAATGIWAPKVGHMAGVQIPLSPMEHLYAVTTPIPEFLGEKEEISQPFVRHQDRAMYFRQEGECYGIGSYQHDPLLVDPENILGHGEATLPPAQRPFPDVHFEQAMESAGELMPSLRDIGLTRKLDGIFSFTPDGFPVLGESPQVKGFWSAQAVWVTHAAGVGKAVAEWIVNGTPTSDLRECDIRRFHNHAYSSEYVRTRAAQQYREVYDIIHPMQQLSEPRDLRLSPFHPRLKEMGGKFFENAGWERPQWYQSNETLLGSNKTTGQSRTGWESREWSPIVAAEHIGTRERVAMFDLTPFAKFEVAGPGALEFLQKLCTNQMDKPVGVITYTSMLTPEGGIKCDLTVTRLGENRFMVVTGGVMGLHDLGWMNSHLPADSSVKITDVTAEFCCIGLWGPRARDLLRSICVNDLGKDAFPYMTSREIVIKDIPVLALRISYVGELGWELYGPMDQGIKLWDFLWKAGESLDVLAAGGGAFDSLRLEKGYRLWGNDIHTEYNPYEAGIGFTARMDKGDFIGREALEEIGIAGLKRKLCCLILDDRSAVVMGKEPILDGNNVLGYVTSANYGYSIGCGIVYAYLPIDYAGFGTKIDIMYFGKCLKATVSKEPLYDPRNYKLNI